MRLLDDLIEQVTRADFFISLNGDACGFGLIERAVKISFLHFRKVGKAQLPILVIFYSAHKGIGNTDGNIKIRDVIFIRLALDKFFHIRMIDA